MAPEINHAPSAGEPAPWFARPDIGAFDEMAGRHIVLFFFGTAGRPDVAAVLVEYERRTDLFDGEHAAFLGISNDPEDRDHGRVGQTRRGQRYLWDFDGALTALYGVVESAAAAVAVKTPPTAFVISPILQIIDVVPLDEPAAFAGRIAALLRDPSAIGPAGSGEAGAPPFMVARDILTAFFPASSGPPKTPTPPASRPTGQGRGKSHFPHPSDPRPRPRWTS